MRISRLFVNLTLNTGECIQLDSEAGHYVRDVLRLKPQQNLMLFNDQGGEYLCCLREVSRKCVVIEVEKFISRTVESNIHIKLGLGISRGDRMDWSVQKSVELGVNCLTPLITERCQIKFNPEKKQQRLTHWRNIIQHAAEQSGRTVLPEIADITHIGDWIIQQQGLKIFLDPFAEQSLHNLVPEIKQVTLMTGPEGGFSEIERELAKAQGFIPVRIGARILRTETAVLAALAAVQTLWGDFK
jgi:16S rRNA (uracil1498-N3)-methyltransferase